MNMASSFLKSALALALLTGCSSAPVPNQASGTPTGHPNLTATQWKVALDEQVQRMPQKLSVGSTGEAVFEASVRPLVQLNFSVDRTRVEELDRQIAALPAAGWQDKNEDGSDGLTLQRGDKPMFCPLTKLEGQPLVQTLRNLRPRADATDARDAWICGSVEKGSGGLMLRVGKRQFVLEPPSELAMEGMYLLVTGEVDRQAATIGNGGTVYQVQSWAVWPRPVGAATPVAPAHPPEGGATASPSATPALPASPTPSPGGADAPAPEASPSTSVDTSPQ